MNKSQILFALKSVLTLFNSARGSAWFNFSYTWLDGTNVVGIVRGNLQADKNTVINLSNILAFVKNSDGTFISELLDIPIIGDNNHLTLDGSSLEFGFTSNRGDLVKFLGSSSDFCFTTSLIIDNVRLIYFEPINSVNWSMFRCFLNKSQYYLAHKVAYLKDQDKDWSKQTRK